MPPDSSRSPVISARHRNPGALPPSGPGRNGLLMGDYRVMLTSCERALPKFDNGIANGPVVAVGRIEPQGTALT